MEEYASELEKEVEKMEENEELLTVQIEEQEKLNRDQIREAESNSIILKELRYEILQLKSKLSVN